MLSLRNLLQIPRRSARCIGRDENGNVSVLFATLLVILAGAAGLAIDFSRMQGSKDGLQLRLDAAVLAGISAKSDQISVAEAYFKGATDTSSSDYSVLFSLNNSSITGRVHAKIKPGLSAVLGAKQLEFDVVSVAEKAVGGKVCALVLDASASPGLLVNGGADVDAPDCEFHVQSNGNPAATFNSGTSLSSSRLCIAGTNILDNGGNHPNMELGCTTSPDPYANSLPLPSASFCDFSNGNFNGGNVNLTPGVYCGWFNFNSAPNVTFAPGVYVIKDGGWNVNGGDWEGNGVVFYFADQSIIQFNSAVRAQITAPTTAPYEGIVMFEQPGLAKSPFVLDDSRGFDLNGLIHLPSRNTTFNSGSGLRSKSFTLIVNTLILNQIKWQVEPDESGIAGGSASGVAHITR